MNELFKGSLFFGFALSLCAYEIGALIRRRLPYAIVNPLMIAICLVMAFLAVFRVEYSTYMNGARYLSWFLTPATVCLAVPLYEQTELLKKEWRAVAAGIVVGVITNCVMIFAMAKLFGLSREMYVTFLPKSVSTAIGIGISEELGGIPPLTAGVIIMTGVTGNMIAVPLFRVLGIKEPVAVGVAIGTASHAIGTARAIEIGPAEGAMSGLAIGAAGMITVAAAPIFAALM